MWPSNDSPAVAPKKARDPGQHALASGTDVPMAHESDSLDQRTAEPLILAGVAAAVGVELLGDHRHDQLTR